MTIFDYLKDILVNKTGKLPLEQYTPYMINRWLSFVHPSVAETLAGCFGSQDLLLDKERHYKLMLSFFPKSKRLPNMQYIKKVKESQTTEDNRIKHIAEALEVSKREATNLVDSLQTISK